MWQNVSLRMTAPYLGAAVCGLVIACFDVRAPFGDDTEKATVLLWLGSAAVLGVLWAQAPWRWALIIAPWATVAHLACQAMGLPDAIHPNNYATSLLILPVALFVCLLGAYAASLIRGSLP